MRKFLLLLIVALLVSCGKQYKIEDSYGLKPVNHYLEYMIDDDTEIPIFNLYTFENNGIEYLTFSNYKSRVILIYELYSGKFVKKICFDGEGANGIGSWLFGFYIKDFQHIYLPSANTELIYLTDTTGVLRQKINFSRTEDGLMPVKAYYTNLDNTQLEILGDSLYIPQILNVRLGEKMVQDSPIGIFVDTLTGKVSRFPFNYPPIIPYNKVRKVIEGPLTSSQVYNGEDWIVSFAKDEKIYRINKKGQAETFLAKSRYIPKFEFPKIPSDFSLTLKKSCEAADYGNILYDKYRKVYYRFVYPETELDSGEDYLKILHTGKKEFSIMILDENFKVLGETRFPAFTYVPHISFINEDGLYLSVSHFKREDYSDDWLRFQRIKLVEKNHAKKI